MANHGLCSVVDCGKPAVKRGLCGSHYKRFWRYGDPRGGASTGLGEVQKWLDRHVSFAGDVCLAWPFATDKSGYGRAWDGSRMAIASRIMCEKANGPAPTQKHEAAHSCGNGQNGCVNPNHLRWSTRLTNEQDKAGHGTKAIGVRQGGAKLTEGDVRQIRALRGVVSQRKLAERFGISPSQVCYVQTRRQWRHLE